MNTAWKYVIVSPVRNEGKHIRHTLESVTRQTVKTRGMDGGVDDGSGRHPGDRQGYAKTYPWIRLVEGTDRGYAKPGRGVIGGVLCRLRTDRAP